MSGEGRDGSVLRRAARSATSPLRSYFNDHFEMVKDEVRNARPEVAGSEWQGAAWERVAELENVFAEQSLYQARVLARVADDVAELTARIADLERAVNHLVELCAPPDAEPRG